MSANPRRVICPDVFISYTWDNATWNLRRNAVIDCAPGSALETAIGASNLSSVIPVSQRGQGDDLARDAQGN